MSSGGYVDASTRGFLSACLAGREVPHTGVHDDQANAFARLPPLVAALAGDARLLPAVRSMVRVTQDSACAAAHGAAAARVLEAIVLGATPAEAVRAAAAAPGNGGDCDDGDDDDEEGRAALRSAIALESEAHADAVAELGRHCHLPASLACAAHAVLTHCDYAAAVRDTILQGGCNASRAGFIGACFAAAHGTGAIPPAWRSACATYERTAVLAAWATGGG